MEENGVISKGNDPLHNVIWKQANVSSWRHFIELLHTSICLPHLIDGGFLKFA